MENGFCPLPPSLSTIFAPQQPISYTSALPIALRWPLRQWRLPEARLQLY